MPKIGWSQVLGTIITAAIIGGTAALIGHERRISYLEGVVTTSNGKTATQGGSAPIGAGADTGTTPILAPVPPDSLSAIIAELQLSNVRESCTPYAGENFSDADLAQFIADHRPKVIADSLRRDPRFLGVILGVKALDAAAQRQILRTANRPLRQTWAERGEVSCKGQTKAGNEAERLIAASIVALSTELLRLSPERIRRLATP